MSEPPVATSPNARATFKYSTTSNYDHYDLNNLRPPAPPASDGIAESSASIVLVPERHSGLFDSEPLPSANPSGQPSFKYSTTSNYDHYDLNNRRPPAPPATDDIAESSAPTEPVPEIQRQSISEPLTNINPFPSDRPTYKYSVTSNYDQFYYLVHH